LRPWPAEGPNTPRNSSAWDVHTSISKFMQPSANVMGLLCFGLAAVAP
jgi:hypothetical protein